MTACKEISEQQEASLFATARHRALATQVRQFLERSRLRLLLVTGLTLTFWGILFALFLEAFQLLHAAVGHPPTLARTVHAAYNVFFLSLLLMISVSSAILFYGAVFRSHDVRLLMTLPARASRIAVYKFQECLVLACWGFILLGSPLLVAYGVANGSNATYYLLILPFMLAFSTIPAAIGAISCLMIISLAPRFRRATAWTVAGGMLVLFLWLGWQTLRAPQGDMLSVFWLNRTITRMQFAEQRFLPSWWLSTGLLEAAHATHLLPSGTVIGFLSVLGSNALMLPCVIGYLANFTLRSGIQRLGATTSSQLGWNFNFLDRLFQYLLTPLSRPMQLVLLKDIRLFRRDPLQWTQFLLFFGLLVLYFFYVRRFQYGAALLAWMTVIGYTNVAVVGLILATFTTRFVFPMISMEGRRFWILGTLPIDRRSILWSKFLFASLVCYVPCGLLILLSDSALQLWTRTPVNAAIHQALCGCLSLGLSALSVGLGARHPDFREVSPAKIAAGFGGTLTLVLSAVFIIFCVLPSSVIAYLLAAEAAFVAPQGHQVWTGWLETARWCTLALAVCGSMIVVGGSLRMGFRAFEALELG